VTLARSLCIALAGLVSAAAPAAAAALPDIHAHRGGTLSFGKPIEPENALPAFKHAKAHGGKWVELDAHVSKDGVPFVMHDDTLKRTTDCTGAVAFRTAAQLGRCHVDILGTDNVFKRAPGATVPVPRLRAVLNWAKSAGARLNIELKHIPGDEGYNEQPNFNKQVLDVIDASKIPKRTVLIQSFWPPNLDPAKQRGYTTVLLTVQAGNPNALALAQSGGYDVLSPSWPVSRKFVTDAHKTGRPVIPYTIDKAGKMRDAFRIGVDGIITNDPPLARKTLRCAAAPKKDRKRACA
jgi:glycerophosphoryl diester phosphodiesterase